MKETSRKQRTVSTARQRHADPIGQRVHDPKADIVATTLILRTGIAQAHHDPQYRTSSGDRTGCLLAFFDLFRLLLADHLRLSRFLLLCSRSPFRRYPLNQYRHHGPRRIVKYLDVARHGQLADMNGVAQIKLADIYLDMTGNRSRQALDGDLAQMRLQQASLDLHPDPLPHNFTTSRGLMVTAVGPDSPPYTTAGISRCRRRLFAAPLPVCIRTSAFNTA